jgi:hypothetical protein
MMEAVITSETSLNLYYTTRRSISQDFHLHTRRRENLKSHSQFALSLKEGREEGRKMSDSCHSTEKILPLVCKGLKITYYRRIRSNKQTSVEHQVCVKITVSITQLHYKYLVFIKQVICEASF